MFRSAYRLHQAAAENRAPLKPCSGSMKCNMGLLCQHDFARILAPDNPHPLLNPGEIHAFWHLHQQNSLQAKAAEVAEEYVERYSAEGSFFMHYPEGDEVRASVPQPNRGMVPQNEYLDDRSAANIREMSPDAAIIQEPLHRPAFVRAQEKKDKAKKRKLGEILNGIGPVEDIMGNLTPTNRLETGNETVNRRMDAAEKKAKQKKGSCGFCKSTDHNVKTCPDYKKAQAAAILAAQRTRAAELAASTGRIAPLTGTQNTMPSQLSPFSPAASTFPREFLSQNFSGNFPAPSFPHNFPSQSFQSYYPTAQASSSSTQLPPPQSWATPPPGGNSYSSAGVYRPDYSQVTVTSSWIAPSSQNGYFPYSRQ